MSELSKDDIETIYNNIVYLESIILHSCLNDSFKELLFQNIDVIIEIIKPTLHSLFDFEPIN